MRKKNITYPAEVYASFFKRRNKLHGWNFIGTFAAGTLAGIVMDKYNMPYSETDNNIAYIVAGSLNTIEYITNRVIKKHRLDTIGDYAWNAIPDSVSFWLGDKLGRYLSRLL